MSPSEAIPSRHFTLMKTGGRIAASAVAIVLTLMLLAVAAAWGGSPGAPGTQPFRVADASFVRQEVQTPTRIISPPARVRGCAGTCVGEATTVTTYRTREVYWSRATPTTALRRTAPAAATLRCSTPSCASR
ncbi:hypothetical protein [Acuticoccus mangrovi]|uniref:Uncharacterized protein n=1 Tax=Acuticoccus mangrovi TaxID=2796142 RepID=A0A934IS36_9HYPH|nr:hypothetical protein [Acuticoccus mangrovi]MBJ3777741.1 hypothetical protein [Acuticoccus mangrovi]